MRTVMRTGAAVIEVENTNKNIHPFAAVKNGSKLNAFAQNKFEIVGVGTGTCWAKGYADGGKTYTSKDGVEVNTNLFKLFQTGMDLSQYTAFYLDDEKL